MTIDDVIFSIYVLCDPTYDGSITLYSQPILGLAEYREGMSILSAAIAAAGEDNTDFSLWTEEQQTAFWNAVNDGGVKFAQAIVDVCVANGLAADSNDVATAAANWAYPDLAADATAKISLWLSVKLMDGISQLWRLRLPALKEQLLLN